MGNKISPKNFRLGIYVPHDANWYVEKKQFASILNEDFQIRKYLEDKIKDSMFSRILINRTLNFIEIKIYCVKPGMVVGKKGDEITKMSEHIKKITNKEVRIKVYDVKKPETNAVIIAKEIANEMPKKSMSTRRLIKKYGNNAMQNGALGVRIECSGRLMGSEIARTEWFQEGQVPRQKLRAYMDYACERSYASWGVNGVKVWVYKGDNLTVIKKKKIKGKEE